VNPVLRKEEDSQGERNEDDPFYIRISGPISHPVPVRLS
jgi:hypothetical protein